MYRLSGGRHRCFEGFSLLRAHVRGNTNHHFPSIDADTHFLYHVRRFHSQCIVDALAYDRRCPICRAPHVVADKRRQTVRRSNSSDENTNDDEGDELNVDDYHDFVRRRLVERRTIRLRMLNGMLLTFDCPVRRRRVDAANDLAEQLLNETDTDDSDDDNLAWAHRMLVPRQRRRLL